MSSRSSIGTSNMPGPIHCKAPAAAAKSQRPAAGGVASTRLARAEEELAVRASVADQEVPGRPDPGRHIAVLAPYQLIPIGDQQSPFDLVHLPHEGPVSSLLVVDLYGDLGAPSLEIVRNPLSRRT